MSERAANDLYMLGYVIALEAAVEETECYETEQPDAWDRGFRDGCASVRVALKRLLAEAKEQTANVKTNEKTG